MSTTTSTHEPYRIGEVAAQVGVTPRTLRYWEELGLLGSEEERPKGGHRLYTEADVARLRELVRLRDLLGLSLEELVGLAEASQARDCLRARYESSSDRGDRARILQDAIPLVERQLELVRRRRQGLDEFEAELVDKLGRMRRRIDELSAGS